MSDMATLQEPRPVYTGMSVAKLERTLGRTLPDWRAGLRQYLEENAGMLKS